MQSRLKRPYLQLDKEQLVVVSSSCEVLNNNEFKNFMQGHQRRTIVVLEVFIFFLETA